MVGADGGRPRWFDRRFDFRTAPALHANLCARLAGAPARVAELLAATPLASATQRAGESWSILENAGHLADLEDLWWARLDDFLAGRDVLTPADLTNAATHEAEHNRRPAAQVVESFRRARGRMVDRLDGLTADDFARCARHPRLDQPMRLIDLCEFVAEHDDHHLANMRALHRDLAT